MFARNEDRDAGDDPEDMGHKLSKKGHKVAVAGARVANENDGTGKCASGEVFNAVKGNVACAVDQRGG